MYHHHSKARSTKTRIETGEIQGDKKGISIRKQDPLKQGLKLSVSAASPVLTWNSKARSTKTRIETSEPGLQAQVLKDSKARSTKTRIETISNIIRQVIDLRIRKQDPLKQGLKRVKLWLRLESSLDSKARSTKTRIETVCA